MSNSLWARGRLKKAGGPPQIVFAQVREDAAIELEVLRSRPMGETAFCIASGGCTAMSLFLAHPSRVYAVDINPAQVFLVELKKAALLHLSRASMLVCLLRNAEPFYNLLRPHLSDAAQSFWDTNSHLLKQGLNNCGVIEKRLRQVMRLLPLVQSRRDTRRLFRCKTLSQQRRVYHSSWNHWRWKLAFEIALCKPMLRIVYGDEFVRAVPKDFASQMRNRVDEAFCRYPIRENGYLWQAFRGAYPPHEAGLPLYLQRENYEAVRNGISHLHVERDDAASWLEAQAPNSIGFFALSNILEIASPAYARRLLNALARAAKPDARVCLRAIFPFDETLMHQSIPSAQLEFLSSHNLGEKDRSFFCKNLRVMRVLKS